MLSMQELTPDKLDEMALIDVAAVVLKEENKAMDFRDIFERVASLKGFTEEQKDAWIAQFYTDLNIDGRFMTKGSNLWGLKRWYPVEEIDEDITPVPKKKRKKKAAKKKKKKPAPVEPSTDDLDESAVEPKIMDFDDEDVVADDLDDFDFDEDDLEDLDDSEEDFETEEEEEK
ncbi:DNA-directed RNA polymerase subunit delta [Gracilibacillus sp. YIM 98692]|uniref:DNA-directed RNA polymerase subunit delta n=1 Tax=Gracilibacillus sp. YIM 98692 TaxID=2663532 RepID=UPI00320490C9